MARPCGPSSGWRGLLIGSSGSTASMRCRPSARSLSPGLVTGSVGPAGHRRESRAAARAKRPRNKTESHTASLLAPCSALGSGPPLRSEVPSRFREESGQSGAAEPTGALRRLLWEGHSCDHPQSVSASTSARGLDPQSSFERRVHAGVPIPASSNCCLMAAASSASQWLSTGIGAARHAGTRSGAEDIT